MQKRVKICIIASSGGHLKQALALSPLMEKFESVLVTEKVSGGLSGLGQTKVYFLNQVNRKEISFIFNMVVNTLKSLRILAKEKPTVVVSTGVLATIPMCVLAKLIGIKVIYIESFAKIHSGTLTGKLLYRVADYFFVQWETMLEVYPKAIFKGGLY